MSKVLFIGPSGEAVIESDPLEDCPFEEEEECPEEIASRCNYNYNCQKNNDR